MKRIFKWDNSRSRKYPKCKLNFDFIEGCKTGLVVWWNESLFCIDLNKLEDKRVNENKIQKAKLEQSKETLEVEHKKLLEDLKIEGVSESELAQTINNLEVEIEETLSECETLLNA